MRLKALMFGLVLAAFAFGQASAQKFDLGLEAGTNFANFHWNWSFCQQREWIPKLGLVGGGFLELNFGDSFAIRPEILYSQKAEPDTGTSTTTYQLDYIEVPVLLKLSLGTPVINPGLILGPSFSVEHRG